MPEHVPKPDQTPDAHWVFLWSQLADRAEAIRVEAYVIGFCTAAGGPEYMRLAKSSESISRRARARAIAAHKRLTTSFHMTKGSNKCLRAASAPM